MKDKESKAAASVDKYTRLGSEELQKGNLERATENFETAYRRSQRTGDDFTSRVCAFNIGAVYIARRQAEKGLAMLHHAIPPPNTKDGRSNGDLFYNFGLGYELQGDSSEAVKYLELALEEYQSERDNAQMVAEVSMKLGVLYMYLGSRLQSARCHATAAASFHKVQDFGQQALCLCQQGSALIQAHKVEDALEVSDNCMIMCQRVKDSNTLGKVYNELGLIYTQCRDFPKAATCFELALPLSRNPGCDKKREAVILQNLGAVYNSLGDFQRSLNLHESAGNLHVELGNRGAQGQCFANLAYANSQLGDYEAAGESYLHALQAARDTNDLHAQWQASEGLGAVSFHQKNVDKAIKYYKLALSTLALSREKNPAAQERIVAKLTDALEIQVSNDKKPPPGRPTVSRPLRNGRVAPAPNVLVNSQPRPPTRDEQREMEKLREARKEYIKSKIPFEFERIALGIGEYDSDSDHSLRRPRSRRSLKRSSSLRSRPRSGSAADEVDLRASRSHSARRNDPRHVASEGDESRPPISRSVSRTSRSSSRRMSKPVGKYQTGRRQGMKPLLREEGYDSAEEWKENMKKGRRQNPSSASSDEELEYRERLYPPSTPEEEKSDNTSRRSSRKSRKKSRTLQEIPIEPKRNSSESEVGPDHAEVVTKAVVEPTGALPPKHVPGPKRPTSAVHDRYHTSMDHTLINQELYREHLDQITRMEESDKTTTDSETQSGTEDEDEEKDGEERRQEEMMPNTMPAHSPPPPPGPTPPNPLISTYETPLPTSPGDEPQEEGGGPQELPYKPGRNYFRMESKPIMEPAVEEEEAADDPKPGPSKMSVPDEEEPLYMTIRSAKATSTIKRRPETESDEEPPEPPPMRQQSQFEQLSRAEQERILFEYQRTRDENNREKVGRIGEDDEDLNLPRKGKRGKETSKMCVVM